MTPKVGHKVLYVPEDAKDSQRFSYEGGTNDGSHLPAVITKVWNVQTVNLKIINDGPHDAWRTSVRLLTELEVPLGTPPGTCYYTDLTQI